MNTLIPAFLQSDPALRSFVKQWESHALPKSDWSHSAHVAVCAFYTSEFGAPEALRLMRQCIPLYNVAVGGQNTEDAGYHETLTCFWAHTIRDFLATTSFPTIYEAVCQTVLRFGQERKLHESYYSFDVVKPAANGCRPTDPLLTPVRYHKKKP